jgi:hypothetical protein
MSIGRESSEFALAKFGASVGLGLIVLGTIVLGLALAGFGNAWVAPAVMAIGAALVALSLLGYSRARATVKAPRPYLPPTTRI